MGRAAVVNKPDLVNVHQQMEAVFVVMEMINKLEPVSMIKFAVARAHDLVLIIGGVAFGSVVMPVLKDVAHAANVVHGANGLTQHAVPNAVEESKRDQGPVQLDMLVMDQKPKK